MESVVVSGTQLIGGLLVVGVGVGCLQPWRAQRVPKVTQHRVSEYIQGPVRCLDGKRVT